MVFRLGVDMLHDPTMISRLNSFCRSQFPRLFPDRTTSQPSHLAFRCVKIVKKSPRTSLIPQDDWLKLIARGESDITQPLIDRDSTVPKPDVDMKAYHEKEDSPSANDRSSCPVANLESPSTSKEPADEDKEEGHAPPPDLSPLQQIDPLLRNNQRHNGVCLDEDNENQRSTPRMTFHELKLASIMIKSGRIISQIELTLSDVTIMKTVTKLLVLSRRMVL